MQPQKIRKLYSEMKEKDKKELAKKQESQVTRSSNGLAQSAESFALKAEHFFEKNAKIVYGVLLAIIVLVVGYFLLLKPTMQKREANAAAQAFKAQYWFDQDNYELALNGSDSLDFEGFASIASSYSFTKTKNLAKYCAGICELNMGNYQEALKYFKSYHAKDVFTKSQVKMLCGDAEMELGATDKAIAYYMQAAKVGNNNSAVAPAALQKAGQANLLQGNAEAALACFQTIKSDYPDATEWSTIDKYIGLAEAALGK